MYNAIFLALAGFVCSPFLSESGEIFIVAMYKKQGYWPCIVLDDVQCGITGLRVLEKRWGTQIEGTCQSKKLDITSYCSTPRHTVTSIYLLQSRDPTTKVSFM